jgi:hypothetical protein
MNYLFTNMGIRPVALLRRHGVMRLRLRPGPGPPAVIGGVGGVVRPWETRQNGIPLQFSYILSIHNTVL